MKASIYNRLRDEGYVVYRCAPGSDGHCYYLISKKGIQSFGDNDGSTFKAVREMPDGSLEVGAIVRILVSGSAQASAKIKAAMGDFKIFVAKAGIFHLRELLQADLTDSPCRDVELHSESPHENFSLPNETDPLKEQRDLRYKILRILAEKHSAGFKRVSKEAVIEHLCTNMEWVDRALVILAENGFLVGHLGGEIKLTPAGYLEAEETIPQPAASTPSHGHGAGSMIEIADGPETATGAKATCHPYDLFVSYASENRTVVCDLVEVLKRRGLKVWWDRGEITLGDRLSAKIDDGLRNSRYGVVIISEAFIAKQWPESELRSMINRSTSSGQKVILPVLLGVTHTRFAQQYPLIGDLVSTQFDGDFNRLADEISAAIECPEVLAGGSTDHSPSPGFGSLADFRHSHGKTVSSFLNTGDLLARLVPYGNVKNASNVTWTNRPQAFLRLVPTVPIGPLTPKAVRDRIFSPPYGLPLFGRPSGSWFEINEFGAVAFNAQEIGQTTASQFVQVFENGEIWAIDTVILSHGKDGQRGIPSMAIEENFKRALTDFLAFARDRLALSLPLRLIAGIDGVMGYSMFIRHGQAGNVVKNTITYETWVDSYDKPPQEYLLPLFTKVWEYAGLDRPSDLSAAY